MASVSTELSSSTQTRGGGDARVWGGGGWATGGGGSSNRLSPRSNLPWESREGPANLSLSRQPSWRRSERPFSEGNPAPAPMLKDVMPVELKIPASDDWVPTLDDTPYSRMGGADAVMALAGAFYDAMDAHEPVLAKLHELDEQGR